MHIFLELHTNVKAARRKYRRRQTVLRSRLEKAAPTAFFRKARRKSLCLVLTMNSVQFIKVNKVLHFFQSSKGQILVSGAGAGVVAAWRRPFSGFFCFKMNKVKNIPTCNSFMLEAKSFCRRSSATSLSIATQTQISWSRLEQSIT